MASNFIYRMQIRWSKRGVRDAFDNVQIYAVKSGGPAPSWDKEATDVNIFKRITLGADGARAFTFCANSLDTYRYLEERNIESFILHIKDTRIRRLPTEEVPTVATISNKDMVALKKVSVSRDLISMSTEPLPPQLFAVTMDFHNSNGGPVFSLTR